MNRIRTLLATVAILAIVPFAAFAEGNDASVTLTMTSVHTLAAGAFALSGTGNVVAFSEVADFGTVALTYSTNTVVDGQSSTITAIAVAWDEPIGATTVPVLKATASTPVGTGAGSAGAGSAAAQVTLIPGTNVPTAQTLVTGITNGDGHTTTVTFAVDASDETIFAGAYSTTVTFTLTASAVGGV